MNRKALIIACPNEKGVSSSLPLPGTKEDANKTESFLLSSAGGGWYASEVRKIIDPTKAVVTEHLKWLYGADYALSFFTGHGGTNTANNKVHLELMDGDILEENLIVAEKQTIIVDTCRTYFTPTKEMLKFADSVGEGVLSIPDARKLYDSAIDYAEPGDPIFLHAASVGQPASAGPDGSYYLLSLLNAAKDYSRNNGSPQIMHVYDAHLKAIDILKNNYPGHSQNPTISGSMKRRQWFPFALRNKTSVWAR